MQWTSQQWVALAWILAIFVSAFATMFLVGRNPDAFWFVLVVPFVTASLLGIWLIAGIGPVWLRVLGMLVVQSLLVLAMSLISDESPVDFTPGLAATTAGTAVAMLGLGCLGSLLPIRSTWSVRIALWEVVISVGLIGVALAIIRAISEMYAWDWPEWANRAGVHFLVFSLYTAALMSLAVLPLLVQGAGPRLLAAVLLLFALLTLPPLESWTFLQFGLNGGYITLFYAAHFGQAAMAWAIMIPLVKYFPGVLVRQTRPAAVAPGPVGKKPYEHHDEHDFADMQ